MKIAVLSWGSLVKEANTRGLQISGEWRIGPVLPVEFSRISQRGERANCLTLVIDEENGTKVPTHYAISSNTSLNAALKNLREVENVNLSYSISYINLKKNKERGFARKFHLATCDIIKAWGKENNFESVVWTSLLPNFETTLGIPFTTNNAIMYINSLPVDTKAKALDYIRNSPAEVVTPVRRLLHFA